MVEKLKVGFVKDHQNVIGDTFHEAVDGFLCDHRSCWIVWIRNKKLPSLRSDRRQHGVEVVGVTGIRNLNGRGAEKLRHEGVNGESMFRGDHFVTRLKKCMADKFDDLVGAITEDDILTFHAEFFRDRITEGPSATIRIKMRTVQHLCHCFECSGGGAERVFIRGEFDDRRRFQTHFAGEFFDRFAGFVGREIKDVLMSGVPHERYIKWVRVFLSVTDRVIF